MGNSKNNKQEFEILRRIAKNPNSSQRELSKELGYSLGKLNYCLRALKNKGLTRYILGNIYAIARIPRIKEFSKLRKKILIQNP